ncbi:uncharacterized protein LOC135091555 [Scylla paramamosain]|uniref:uncharacterized protein LOC135091555 n=1 Tax=Scylla paramamosain TaxID=85552 RepID=UPI0030828397
MSRILYGCCKQYVGGSHQFRNYQGIQSPSKCQEAFIQCSADTNLPKEISILGDFNVHHQLWLSSPFTDHPGELAYNFAILHDLEQLVQHPTRIPDCLGDTPNILDLFPQPQPQPQPFHPSLSQCILASPSPSQPLSVHSSLSQSIPASPSPSQPLSVHSSLSQSIPASPSPSQPLPEHPRLSQSIPASPSPSQPLPVHFSLSQSIPASLSAFQPLPVHPSLSQCILASPPVHPSLSQCIPASPSPSQPLPVHPSLSQCIPASPSPSQPLPVIIKQFGFRRGRLCVTNLLSYT